MSGRAGAALALLALSVAGCGGNGDDRSDLVVAAATSLGAAFEEYGRGFAPARVRLSLAGSDAQAAQVRRGAPIDVVATADARLADSLFEEGVVEEPVRFAGNRVVVAVPAVPRRVRRLEDLGRPGVTLAVAAPSVPAGAYARRALRRLGGTRARRALANVVSEEPDVGGVTAKLLQRAVDAGVVYATDVRAARGRLHGLDLPPVRPPIAYAAAVGRRARHPREARRFVAGLRAAAGQRALRAAGFLPPP